MRLIGVGGAERISNKRSITVWLSFGGGCLRARDWLRSTATSSAGAARKRLVHARIW